MSCNACNCVTGENYILSSGYCTGCGTEHGKFTGTYIGKEDDKHVFRVHNYRCPGCGLRVSKSFVPCHDSYGIDVTEEFNLMFHNKESHWVGGSNAKRQPE